MTADEVEALQNLERAARSAARRLSPASPLRGACAVISQEIAELLRGHPLRLARPEPLVALRPETQASRPQL
jgi:hypothetical protein